MKVMQYLFAYLGKIIIKKLSNFGEFIIFLYQIAIQIFTPPFRFKLLVKQLEFVGNKSAIIIFVAALFVGAVLGLQLGVIFRLFSAESLMGAATGKSLALELGPIMCSFIVVGRAGAAMAAEIATMRVNEQLEAMEAMGVNPLNYLVIPRLIASIIMLPFLTGIFIFIGVIGCYAIASTMYNIDYAIFIQQLQQLVSWQDILKGLQKSLFFAFIFSTIACYHGCKASGGAKGVGEATTKAVVNSLLTILIADFLISLIQVN